MERMRDLELEEATTQNLIDTFGPKIWYMASPYSDPDKMVQESRAKNAIHFAGYLMSRGLFIYSPIWMCHRPSVEWALPGNYEWWQAFDRASIDAAVGVIVLQLPGWDKSRGVTYEIDLVNKLHKPIYYMSPTTKKLYGEPTPF